MSPNRKADISDLRDTAQLEENLASRIFSASSTLVGVCMTVIGIIHLVVSTTKEETISDDLLAVASLLFLAACLLSYCALRVQHRKRMHRIEKLADAFFLGGMVMLPIVSFIVTYSVF